MSLSFCLVRFRTSIFILTSNLFIVPCEVEFYRNYGFLCRDEIVIPNYFFIIDIIPLMFHRFSHIFFFVQRWSTHTTDGSTKKNKDFIIFDDNKRWKLLKIFSEHSFAFNVQNPLAWNFILIFSPIFYSRQIILTKNNSTSCFFFVVMKVFHIFQFMSYFRCSNTEFCWSCRLTV